MEEEEYESFGELEDDSNGTYSDGKRGWLCGPEHHRRHRSIRLLDLVRRWNHRYLNVGIGRGGPGSVPVYQC